MSMHAAPARAGTVSRALARDKLGMLAVLAFILASIAPMTVAAGVIPTAYAVTGLTGIPAAFGVVVVVLARVEVAGRVLAVLTAAEIAIVVAQTISGLVSPAGGHLDLGALSPAALTASGAGTLGVLAVIAGLAFVGFEQSPVLGRRRGTPGGPSPPPPTPRWPPSGRCTPPRPGRCRPTPAGRTWPPPRRRRDRACCTAAARAAPWRRRPSCCSSPRCSPPPCRITT